MVVWGEILEVVGAQILVALISRETSEGASGGLLAGIEVLAALLAISQTIISRGRVLVGDLKGDRLVKALPPLLVLGLGCRRWWRRRRGRLWCGWERAGFFVGWRGGYGYGRCRCCGRRSRAGHCRGGGGGGFGDVELIEVVAIDIGYGLADHSSLDDGGCEGLLKSSRRVGHRYRVKRFVPSKIEIFGSSEWTST